VQCSKESLIGALGVGSPSGASLPLTLAENDQGQVDERSAKQLGTLRIGKVVIRPHSAMNCRWRHGRKVAEEWRDGLLCCAGIFEMADTATHHSSTMFSN